MSAPQPTNQNFTEAETKAFAAKKSALYKGSIAVCVVYGVVALCMILLATLTQSGKELLSTQLRTFVVTLIVGIMIVIIIISIMIYTAAPTKIETVLYDRDVCPDYWKLEKTNLDIFKNPEAKIKGGNVCVRDTNILSAPTGSYPLSENAPAVVKDVHAYASEMGLQTTDLCNRIYPTALGLADETKYASMPNTMRCDLAEKCGFAWSSVCS